MADLMTVAVLEKRLKADFTEDEAEDMTAYLADISDEIRDVARPLLDTVEPPDVPGAVNLVIIAAARRYIENPRGLTGENLGDYGWQGSTQGAGGSLTKDEVKRIRKAVGKSSATSDYMETDLPLAQQVTLIEDLF